MVVRYLCGECNCGHCTGNLHYNYDCLELHLCSIFFLPFPMCFRDVTVYLIIFVFLQFHFQDVYFTETTMPPIPLLKITGNGDQTAPLQTQRNNVTTRCPPTGSPPAQWGDSCRSAEGILRASWTGTPQDLSIRFPFSHRQEVSALYSASGKGDGRRAVGS